jgi:hypothetical protein
MNPTTLWRWFTVGVRGPDGTRIHLEAVKCGSTWITSREALARFMEATTPRPAGISGDIATSPRRTPTQRRKDNERAKKKLAAIGILG